MPLSEPDSTGSATDGRDFASDGVSLHRTLLLEQRVTLTPGSRIGRFEILGLVGAGGMGEVYRARDPELEREVAIKVLPAELAQDSDRLRRFEREARIIARLDHPNLLAIHDVGHHDGAPYLVFELLEGRPLDELVGKGPVPMRDATAYGRQIAEGLAAAHEQGVIHRDLKPGNLFLTEEGRVKILDFGLGKLYGEAAAGADDLPTLTMLSEQGAVMGTTAYMAPEQAAGRGVDHRSDQFSFGVVLYELLAGRRPFGGETPQESLTAVLRDDPEPLATAAPDVPAPMRWIVERCLARDPADRYDATRDLAKDLRSAAEKSAELAGRGRPGSEPSRRIPWRFVTAGLLVGALAVATVAGFLLARQDPDVSRLSYQRITFRRGTVTGARFEPGSDAVLYSATWEGGPSRVYLHRPGALDPIGVGPPGSRLLSVSPDGELLLLHDPFALGPFSTAGELARMPVGGAPRNLAGSVADAVFGPDGELAALVREAEGQAVVEFPPGTPRLSSRGIVQDVRLSPDGSRLAFGETPGRGHEWGQVVVLDRDGTETRLEQTTGRGMAWSPSGDEIWLAKPTSLLAVTLDGEERLMATFPGEVTLFDVSAEGRVLLSIDQLRFEMVGRPAGDAERDLTWLYWSVPFDITGDGETILFNECVEGGPPCHVSLRGFGTDPPVVLGEGFGLQLSPDGGWVVSAPPWSPRELGLVATGTGERRTLILEELERIGLAAWSPDGGSLLINGNVPGEGNRIFRVGLEGGSLEPLTPEGIAFGFFAVSPDGGTLAAPFTAGGIGIYPLGGGEPEFLEIDEQPLRWSADGRSIYTAPLAVVPARLQRVDVASGATEVVTSLLPSDPAGVVQISPVAVTPDGTAYVYGYVRKLSDLYVVEGLR